MLMRAGPQHNQPLVANGDAYSQLTLTHLSDPGDVSDTFAQGKQSYANKNYDEAVKLLNRAIEILEQDLSIALLHRAAALEMKHDYEGVIQDSSRVNPDNKSTVPDPYVTAAHALLLQNRLPEAAEHLRAGIAAVPKTCKQHQTLVHLNNRVATEMDARNQWMVKLLPNEILDRILSLLPTKTHINLASTCRFWNSFMLRDWSGMWSTIDATTYDDLPKHDPMLQRVLTAVPASRVRRVILHMSNVAFLKQSATLLSIIRRRRWNKIEYLGIRSPQNKVAICSLLQLTKNSLQTLELWSTDNNTDAEKTLINAPKMCPNISSITRHIQGRQKLHQILPQLNSSKLVLTRLKILGNSQHLNYTRQEDASLLQTLAHTIGSITDQYPSLQEFVIDSLCRNNFLTTTYSRPSAKTGLTKVALTLRATKNDTVSFDKQICSMMQKNRSSLLSMELNFGEVSHLGSCKSVEEIAKIGFPVLKNLDFCFSDSFSSISPSKLQDLLASCPALEQVRISASKIWDASIWRGLSKLTCLRRLTMYMEGSGDAIRVYSDGGSGLANLLSHSQKLYYFSFGYDSDDDDDDHRHIIVDVARRVGRSSTIKQLDLSTISIRSSDDLISISDAIKDSQVRILGLQIDFLIRGNELQALASLRNLTLLEIHDPERRITKKQLIRIFNKHMGGTGGLFVVHAIYNRSHGLLGSKQYPITSVVRMEDCSNEDIQSYYSIHEHTVIYDDM